MNRILFSTLLIIPMLFLFSLKENDPEDEKVQFFVPQGWPAPHYDFSKNPLTKTGIHLGRKLFYDEKLSRDSTISCASCHLSYTGFTHIDHLLSHGIEGRIGYRNTQTIVNPAWQKTFMWDGSINHLDMQPLAPLQNESEMDNSLENIITYLKSSSEYRTLFAKVFQTEDPITVTNMQKSMSQFMLQFNSYNSKYDQVMRGEKGAKFTKKEEQGLEVFRNQCESCHKEPLFTDFSYRNNGLSVIPKLQDYGRYTVTGQSEDSLMFKVPSLRNVEVTFPYMHDGRYLTLDMAIHHYDYYIEDNPTLSKEIKSIHLTEKDKKSLMAFLKTLTDKSFLRNRALAYPRK
ncbi:cytochrome-c peroxidase [Flammeovirga sp. EKP202]|uniref:cytochrome-c peroxidase n=1 Tax=Flammeovirga sp. EKP202 TaxID=2770592 RepID=UPI00165F2505|nr:cytochrome c peroxidase [Flammeovirga sp. EKP202]MBD0404246.1 cytochrome-c peroxidase [Flammeovirga sp. EKP202]